MPGELSGDRVVVRDQAEANRLYNKGWFGRPRSGGSLELDLVEAAFLLEAGRLTLGPDGSWDARRFLTQAAVQEADFEVRYHVYRELRERGWAPQIGRRGEADFLLPARDASSPRAVATRVRALSERSPAVVRDLLEFARTCREAEVGALVAVVDEESEVTTYNLGLESPTGDVTPDTRLAGDGVLMVDRVALWDEADAKRLHEREFFGKPAGGRLYLSLVEALHLARHRALRVQRAGDPKPLTEPQLSRIAKRIEPGVDLRRIVFDDLKTRRLVVKTGYKFGTHFRAYERDPVGTHAPFLVQCVLVGERSEWPQLARAVRLAHGVRKVLLLAVVDGKLVHYVRVVRAK